MIPSRLQALRREMERRGISLYVIPTADFHESEYVGEHFKTRKYITGFTGSAGTLIVTRTGADQWADGRYYIQAERQLRGSGITLQRLGEPDVPTVEELLESVLPEGGVLGFDGRVVSARMGEALQKRLAQKNVTLHWQEDLVDSVWPDRPPLPAEPAFLLDVKYCGASRTEKLRVLRAAMEKEGADVHLLTTLDDIAWLFNLRGNDIPCNPVVLAYAAVTETQAILFLNEKTVAGAVRSALEADGVEIAPYDAFYAYAAALPENAKVLADCGRISFAAIRTLPAGATVIDRKNPTTLAKALKNETELASLRECHIKDGVAFVRFMRWLKENVGRIPMTERSAAEYLEDRRKEQEGYIEPSFSTISAYGPNAAMMHYSATEESDAVIEAKGMLLMDSGGQYFGGTTDITRTMILGPLPEVQKLHFTAVARGMLNLQSARFLHGCRGVNLDILARAPMWEMGIDYRCGTGHGVGFLLNVHEGPNNIRWKVLPGAEEGSVLEPGMVTTDEPGVYTEGEYGIRTENELVCQKDVSNEYGQFLCFEPITYAPIDLDGILPEAMTAAERSRLNDYHQMVYETLSPYLAEDERQWLRHQTRAI